MKQDKDIREFYNNYGKKEWDRLEESAFNRLVFTLHMDFLKEKLIKGTKVLDAGCGAGRYSIEFARKGCNLSILDISEKQLELAKQKLEEQNLLDQLKESFRTSLSNMSLVPSNSFDLTVCYGAPLNYMYENYIDGIKELYRVTKPGGSVVTSVNSRLGIFRMLFGNNNFDICDFLTRTDYWYVDEVLKTGNLPKHPEVSHPPRHFFKAIELSDLFKSVGFKNIELGSSPSVISGFRDRAEIIYEDKLAWETLVRIELDSYKNENLADSGEFVLIKAIK